MVDDGVMGEDKSIRIRREKVKFEKSVWLENGRNVKR